MCVSHMLLQTLGHHPQIWGVNPISLHPILAPWDLGTLSKLLLVDVTHHSKISPSAQEQRAFHFHLQIFQVWVQATLTLEKAASWGVHGLMWEKKVVWPWLISSFSLDFLLCVFGWNGFTVPKMCMFNDESMFVQAPFWRCLLDVAGTTWVPKCHFFRRCTILSQIRFPRSVSPWASRKFHHAASQNSNGRRNLHCWHWAIPTHGFVARLRKDKGTRSPCTRNNAKAPSTFPPVVKGWRKLAFYPPLFWFKDLFRRNIDTPERNGRFLQTPSISIERVRWKMVGRSPASVCFITSTSAQGLNKTDRFPK